MLRGTRETEIRQPPTVRERPSFAARIPAPLSEEERLQAVLRLRAYDHGVFAPVGRQNLIANPAG